ncbi:lipid A biosynthesis acyltransferase [Flavobacterium franklandianum]|uniref:Lipid A biosynthesis acyltransferase n=1 Tax=Flavobacterium franklandianum TaxID=2594430 RepID=A0A553C7D7_9FLAO|nr:lysophospholipid acyltransferase family protein [Flavobacterium franklandianum]TRX16322.1 lipid A biosynthesis acyltransferase [Flavobacterium franklandianum]TRX24292.1 lipid A biosynthesis acyltransferase [Flavobacterium franklandianum]
MRFIIYLIVYPFLWCISMLPFRLLYLFSDFIYLIVYYIIGYRKKTVRKNIALALPHLSDQERLIIEKKSFQHLCDMFLEMIKTMTISKNEISKRFVFTNLEVYQKLEGQNKSIAMMMAHYASYEWAISMNTYVKFSAFAIYKKLSNPYFDKLVRNIRSRFKATLITTKETIPLIIENNKNKKLALYGFASDQSPRVSTAFHWQKFMGIEVPVHTGAEMLSKKYNMFIVFLKVKKVKRGYYEASFEVLSENASAVPNYEITDKFLKLVEQQIHEAPEHYLWTHNRWKHRR